MGINVGHRRTYNYHIGNNIEAKTPMNIVEAWYPKTASEHEYRILSKIDELSDHKDGVSILLKNDITIPSLYLTYDLPLIQDKHGQSRYKDSSENRYECNRRAKERFESMKSRGLLCGNSFSNPAITIVGRQAIECKRDNDNDSVKQLHDSIIEIIQILKSQSEISEEIIKQLVNASEKIPRDSSASKVMEISNTICTTITAIPTIVSGINIGAKYLPIVFEAVNNLLKGTGIL